MAFCEIHFLSQTLSQNVSAAVFIPEKGPFGSDAKPPYRTVYLLPGYSGDCTSIYTMLPIRKQAELKGLCVVIPNGQNAFYIDHPERNASWSRFIGEELVARTREMFRLSDRREDTYIAGISMGGYGALLNGLRYRKVFSRIAALSPAADPGELFSHAREGGFGPDEFANLFGSLEAYENGPWNLRKIYPETNPAEIPELFVGCGDHDIAVWRQVKDFLQALDQAGIPCRRWQNHGNHDIDTWEAMMDPAFSFLAGIPEGTRNSLAIPEAASARDAVVQ